MGAISVKIRKLVLLLLLTMTALHFCGCSNITFKEFESINYQGQVYTKDSLWLPTGKITADKIPVYLINHASSVDEKSTYYAFTYSNDPDCVFLSLNNVLYAKDNYHFPDILDESVELSKVVLTVANGTKSHALKDSDLITKFVNEYRNQNHNSVKAERYNPKQYDFRFYIKDYFACFYGGRISEDTNGHLGFEDYTSKKYLSVRKLSADLEESILSVTK
jgi:hypothetical protein